MCFSHTHPTRHSHPERWTACVILTHPYDPTHPERRTHRKVDCLCDSPTRQPVCFSHTHTTRQWTTCVSQLTDYESHPGTPHLRQAPTCGHRNVPQLFVSTSKYSIAGLTRCTSAVQGKEYMSTSSVLSFTLVQCFDFHVRRQNEPACLKSLQEMHALPDCFANSA